MGRRHRACGSRCLYQVLLVRFPCWLLQRGFLWTASIKFFPGVSVAVVVWRFWRGKIGRGPGQESCDQFVDPDSPTPSLSPTLGEPHRIGPEGLGIRPVRFFFLSGKISRRYAERRPPQPKGYPPRRHGHRESQNQRQDREHGGGGGYGSAGWRYGGATFFRQLRTCFAGKPMLFSESSDPPARFHH